MVTAVKEKEDKEQIKPKFRNPDEMTEEELTDPDYRLKQIAKLQGQEVATCSKCHHCR